MLAAIREHSTGILAFIIIGLIIASFALWGVSSYFEGGPSLYVAEGGGIKVSQRVYQNSLQQYRSSVSPEQFDSKIFKTQILEKLIAESLLARDALQNGYSVSNQTLRLYIEKQPYFQRNKEFDTEIYKTALATQRMGMEEYEAQLRAGMIQEQVAGIYNESTVVTNAEVSQVLALMMQQRKIDYTIIEPQLFMSDIQIQEEEFKGFYEANKERFQTPETVQIEYIELSASELIGDYQPTDDELRALYKTESGMNMVSSENRRISHILIEAGSEASPEDQKKALDKATALAAKIKKGASFSSLAKIESDDPGSAEKGGDLGYLAPGVMVKEFETAAFVLKKGEVSEPVKTKFGYHLIKLTDYKASVKLPFSKVRSKLAGQARQQKGEQRFYDLTEIFYNLTFENPDSLQPAADELGLMTKKSAWFGRSGGAGIASRQKVVAATFNPEVLEQGRNSEVIELDDTSMVVVRIAGYHKQQARPLAEVQSDIINHLKREKALEKAVQLRDKVVQALKDGKMLRAQTQRHKLKYNQPKPLIRNKTKEVDARIISAVFKARRPEQGKVVTGSVDLGGKGYAVFVLKHVVEGDPMAADAKTREQVTQQLNQFRGSDYFQYYGRGLRQQADVRINAGSL